MKGCPVCYSMWGDEVNVCHTVTSRSKKICGARLK